MLKALGLAEAQVVEILQARRVLPYPAVPGTFGGRGLGFSTQIFRVEAQGIVDGRVAARVTAVVQKRPGTPVSVSVLEWSGLR